MKKCFNHGLGTRVTTNQAHLTWQKGTLNWIRTETVKNRPQTPEENFSCELRTNAQQQWEYYIQMARRKQNNKEMDSQNRACHILTKVQHFPSYRKNQVGEVPRARVVTRAREAKKGKILVKPKISLLKHKMQKTDRHIQKSKPSKKPPLEGRETMNTHAPLLNGPHRWS